MNPWLASLALAASLSTAHAAIDLATFPIPVHVESETQGLFVELTLEIAKATGEAVAIRVLPPPRAVQGYLDGGFAGLFPALDVNFAPGQAITRTAEPLDCKEDFVFTRKGAPLLRTMDDLKGKRVGITRGYPYAREVTDSKAYTVEAGPSDDANIHKLVTGRLDAFVLDEKTGTKAFQALGMSSQMQYDPASPVSRQEVYYAFQNTATGQALASRFSQALAQMKADGRYARITRGITAGGGCVRVPK